MTYIHHFAETSFTLDTQLYDPTNYAAWQGPVLATSTNAICSTWQILTHDELHANIWYYDVARPVCWEAKSYSHITLPVIGRNI